MQEMLTPMHACTAHWTTPNVVFGILLFLLAPNIVFADPVTGVEAVASKVAKDYVRAKMPDGSFVPELYAFGDGGNWGGEIKDLTIDKLTFLDVAHVIAPPLATQKYLPGTDPAKVKLLVMLYWGTTAVPPPYEEDPLYHNYLQALEEYRRIIEQTGGHLVNDQAVGGMVDEANDVLSAGLHQLDIENRIRDRIDFKNAAMLGYDMSGLIGTEQGNYLKHTALRQERNDEVDEIEDNRYFVVLMAYDFQLLWKQKKHKLLWETRFSINQKHNEFDKTLPAMAEYAEKYFGQASNGLVRKRLLDANVEIGEPTLIQFLAEPKK
jgi:hypothetical protein